MLMIISPPTPNAHLHNHRINAKPMITSCNDGGAAGPIMHYVTSDAIINQPIYQSLSIYLWKAS